MSHVPVRTPDVTWLLSRNLARDRLPHWFFFLSCELAAAVMGRPSRSRTLWACSGRNVRICFLLACMQYGYVSSRRHARLPDL